MQYHYDRSKTATSKGLPDRIRDAVDAYTSDLQSELVKELQTTWKARITKEQPHRIFATLEGPGGEIELEVRVDDFARKSEYSINILGLNQRRSAYVPLAYEKAGDPSQEAKSILDKGISRFLSLPIQTW